MLRKSTTVRFLLSSFLSLLGNSVAAVVLPLILLARTGDPLAAGTLALICAIPQALAGILGGVLLDRINRRLVSIVSDVISAFSVAMLLVIDLTIGLSFEWFAILGIVGALGDVPGMTARDTLCPDVAKHDGVELQGFLGLLQSLQALGTIIGPALAALIMGFIGGTLSLGVTAALSLVAAFITLTLSRKIGVIPRPQSSIDPAVSDGMVLETAASLSVFASLREGFKLLFVKDSIIRLSVFLVFGITMIMGSYQGLVLPVFFTETNQPELLGYVLSALSFGLLAGSLVYSSVATRLKKHRWYVLSLIGMALGVTLMGILSPYPLLLIGAALLGAASAPISALLNLVFIVRVPEEQRGSVLGTQNSLLLVVAPVAIFLSSVIVTSFGVHIASYVLIGCWFLVTLGALLARNMRKLDDPEV